MKLIAFVAISFLAITVSAYPGLGTPPQSTTAQSAEQHQSTSTDEMQQSQSTDTRIPQQPYEDEVLAELEELEEALKKIETPIFDLNDSIIAMAKEMPGLELEISILRDELFETRMTKSKAQELNTAYTDKHRHWSKLCSSINAKQMELKKVLGQYDDMKARLEELKKPQE
ncbi:hypothetical protein BASA50_001097 [Batrachochytrium salamandrivorans]|uniref:Uncharacterized protein n=1 Tax=Batrachochytrium salamandrivorans TaxID=1357716 RepID=A0ABQ8ERM7_9FUNG|nr:hypothetical protein BASA62_003572 [Batrachochytrium salamandrivorans]KAH6580542.1 hypothetical protein BASA60_002827 [Batrachochytrium salamandrivorans]KAH6585488.1 hypothetical protein BASA50_001097 [Batrachochytrium salamandrivorans]KAH6591168.1 hypothetical protein BASA61_005068 [Batrachochytrium salamandrivorans]KAH9248134.1 hypothetical protein BASA81_014208 [Batrachochytrium salamandrivorans]